MGITEHIEGDECKFSVWTGRAPAIENKAIMKVTNHIYFSTDSNPLIATPENCNLPINCTFSCNQTKHTIKVGNCCNFLSKRLTQKLQLFS